MRPSSGSAGQCMPVAGLDTAVVLGRVLHVTRGVAGSDPDPTLHRGTGSQPQAACIGPDRVLHALHALCPGLV